MPSPSSLIDQAQLRAIAEGMPEMVLEILQDFLADATQKTLQLQDNSDPLLQKAILHRLKGSSGTLGLARFAGTCLNLEEALTTGKALTEEQINHLSHQMKASCHEAKLYLEAL